MSEGTREPATLTRDQTAAELRMSVQSVDRMIKRHDLPAIKVNRLVRIPRAAVDELLRARGGSDAVDAWVERVVATAPPLTEAQRAKLAELLKPVRKTGGAA